MSLCRKCGELEAESALANNGVMAAVVISEFEKAVNRTSDQRAALVDKKLENLRQTLLSALEAGR